MNKRHYAQFILANYPDSREDDSKLLLYHLRRMGCVLDADQTKAFLNAFKPRSADMLIRDRQYFNEHGEYLPENSQVMKARRRKEVQVRMELKEEEPPRQYRTWVDQNGYTHAAVL